MIRSNDLAGGVPRPRSWRGCPGRAASSSRDAAAGVQKPSSCGIPWLSLFQHRPAPHGFRAGILKLDAPERARPLGQ